MGSISRKCSLIPNSFKYSVQNSHEKDLILISSKNSIKSNILCIHECQEFEIRFGKERFPRGRIVRESKGFKLLLVPVALAVSQRDEIMVEKVLVLATIVLIVSVSDVL